MTSGEFQEADFFATGVELAYVLDYARDLDGKMHQNEADLTDVFRLAEETDSFRQTTDAHAAISDLSDDIFLAFQVGNFSRSIELNQKILNALYEAIDKLIGRDAYVQGMNPQESKK